MRDTLKAIDIIKEIIANAPDVNIDWKELTSALRALEWWSSEKEGAHRVGGGEDHDAGRRRRVAHRSLGQC